jgi:hypothetical protein
MRYQTCAPLDLPLRPRSVKLTVPFIGSWTMFTSSEDFLGVASAPFIGTLNHGGFWLGSFIC